ncbi:MAG: hypothetical protein C9356_12065 [Oleiphilus sp.]|nr:MAG: hypothetical protein C9356_12065 [Oleiphilus sp.]
MRIVQYFLISFVLFFHSYAVSDEPNSCSQWNQLNEHSSDAEYQAFFQSDPSFKSLIYSADELGLIRGISAISVTCSVHPDMTIEAVHKAVNKNPVHVLCANWMGDIAVIGEGGISRTQAQQISQDSRKLSTEIMAKNPGLAAGMEKVIKRTPASELPAFIKSVQTGAMSFCEADPLMTFEMAYISSLGKAIENTIGR